MKFIQKMVLAGFALLGCGSAFGYTWEFVNVTDNPIIIEFKLLAWSPKFYNLVQPGKRTRFNWPLGSWFAGYCVEDIKMVTYDPTMMSTNFPGANSAELPKSSANAKFYDQAKIDAALADRNSAWYRDVKTLGFREATINWIPGKSWGMFDKAMQDAASKIAGGVATSAGLAIDAAIHASAAAATGGASLPATALVAGGGMGGSSMGGGSMGGGMGGMGGGMSSSTPKLSVSKLLEPFGGVVGGVMQLLSRSKCMSRNFDIIETKEQGLGLFTKEQ